MDDILLHYGVLGMKWGVRKSEYSMTTKSGDVITIKDRPASKLAAFIAKHSPKAAAEADKTANYDIKDPKGKTIGDLSLYQESPKSLNIVWVTTDESVRGRGYGSAVMKSAIKLAKDAGMEQVTLEVPGESPDARHIYESLGFKEMPSPTRDPNDVWGGLTNMRLDLKEMKQSSLSHGSGLITMSDERKRKFSEYLVEEIDSLTELAHYGILGMKWGKRKAATPGSKDYEETKGLRKKAAKDLSDAELKKAIARMQLEKQYKDLRAADVAGGQKFVTSLLKEVGKETVKEYMRTGIKSGVNWLIEMAKEPR